MVSVIISELKNKFPELILITDVALDPYTDSGHDGIIIGGEVDNDETLKSLESMSLNLAHSGSDIIAPSDMMDGRVKAIRDILESNSFFDTVRPIRLTYLSYASSNFVATFKNFSPQFSR